MREKGRESAFPFSLNMKKNKKKNQDNGVSIAMRIYFIFNGIWLPLDEKEKKCLKKKCYFWK
jgi:hypothetical protein